MKKVIAAAAAFAMVAGIASVASAAVDLSGSARARFVYTDDGTTDETHWDSRVRVVFSAKSKGGAFAKARLRMIDAGWDGQAGYTAANGGDKNVWVDYAYLGVPLGNGWTMQAGDMPTNFSRWFTFDERADRFALIHKSKGQVLAFTYDKVKEVADTSADAYLDADGAVVDATVDAVGAADDADDNDKNKIGIKYIKDINENAKLGLRAVYVQDETAADLSGMVGSAYLSGKAGEGNYHVELAYKSGDTKSATADDMIGGYASWQGPMGSMNPDFRLGFTQDGYKADNDFGWIMIGFAEPITVIDNVGEAGDTIFASASNTFQLSEKTSLTGNLVYMDVDAATDSNALELSAVLAYNVSEGAVLSFSAGYLDDERTSDDNIGAYGKLEISY